MLKRFLGDEGGQDLIEYALVAAILSLVAIAGMRSYASAVANAFSYLGNGITTAV